MATKIINVLRDDSFEEILDIFNKTPAKEVIFVLPKTAKALKSEEDFKTLSQCASSQNKNFSLLCYNPSVNKLAKQYKFDILLAKTGESSGNISTVNQLDDAPPWGDRELPGFVPTEKKEPESDDELAEENAEPIAQTMSQPEPEELPEYKVVRAVKVRRMEDVIPPPEDDESHIKIKQSASRRKEKASQIEVKKEVIEDEIEEKKEYSGIWSDWNIKDKDKEKSKKTPKTRLGFNSKNVMITMAIVAAVLLGVTLYVSTGSAKIFIKPKKQEVNFRLKASASDAYTTVDVNSGKIPGQVFTIEKKLSQKFTATGQKDAIQKARGKITVNNELNTPQPLVATTRFESESGKVFRTLKTINVPAAGSTEVEVISDKPGQEYNIPPGKFTIIAFKEKGDAERYQKVYAKSSDSMHGGINGKATVVSQSDYDKANEALLQQLSKDIADALKSQAAQFKIVNGSSVVVSDPVSTAGPDDAASEFTMEMSATIKAVGIKEGDMYKLINEHAQKTDNLEVILEKVQISYEKIALNSTGNMLQFELIVKGNGYASADEETIIEDLMGMDGKEIKDYFQSNQNIESVRVVLSPFWVRKVPKDRDKI